MLLVFIEVFILWIFVNIKIFRFVNWKDGEDSMFGYSIEFYVNCLNLIGVEIWGVEYLFLVYLVIWEEIIFLIKWNMDGDLVIGGGCMMDIIIIIF